MTKYLDENGLAFYDIKMKERLDKKADKTSVPTKTSQLTNDSNFVTADNIPSYTESDPTVPAWAKEATKPTYTAAEVGAIPASEADNFAKKSDIGTVYKYKGTVQDVASLPTSNNVIGDVYNVEETDMNYGWMGTGWDPLGQPFQIEALTTAEIDAIMNS